MRKACLLIVLAAIPSLTLAADRNNDARVEVKKVETQGVGGLLEQMWATLRRYAPRMASDDGERRVTLVAGVRGAESTTSALQPYWKGDKSQDTAYQAEVAAYNRAQALADQGDYRGAAGAFEAFAKTHASSGLRANALFAVALSHAGAGDRSKAVNELQVFIKDYPQHPLRTDAERMLQELRV